MERLSADRRWGLIGHVGLRLADLPVELLALDVSLYPIVTAHVRDIFRSAVFVLYFRFRAQFGELFVVSALGGVALAEELFGHQRGIAHGCCNPVINAQVRARRIDEKVQSGRLDGIDAADTPGRGCEKVYEQFQVLWFRD